MDTITDWNEMLAEHFGFAEFRPGQEDVLRALEMHGRALAVFPTGAGKSLCYQLPALTYDGLTLVVSPLIALMKDQIDFLKRKGIEAARLDSSLSMDQAREIQDKVRGGIIKLLYVAPERFKNERFLEMIGQQKISLFAIDEAHCISEWGHNFRPDYLKLAQTAADLKVERVLTLTATATPKVVTSICERFDIPAEAAVVTGFFRKNLKLAITPTAGGRQRDELLLRRLKGREPGPTIIYVTLQKTAQQVAELLQQAGYEAECYHAGMDPDERSAVQERWMASDRRIVVATIAFGMGIDKADVRYVYHYNLPKSVENYSQEIGRAGRDGRDSVVEMFAATEDIPTLENFVYGDTPTDAALHGLVDDLLGRGEQFDISMYDFSMRHDIRQLVLKTALTYLELMGAIREGAPYYAGYKFVMKRPVNEIAGMFPGERGEFIKQVMAAGKTGVKWTSLNPDNVAERIGQPRQRIVTALDYLHGQGLIDLQASEVRNRFTRPSDSLPADELATELVRRFEQREADEIARIAALIGFIEHVGCHANALAKYFGEDRDEQCGSCAQCITGKAVKMPAGAIPSPEFHGQDREELEALRQEHPGALGRPRQRARFLCGIGSPALTKAKLTKNRLFGVWQEFKFKEVLTKVQAET